MLLNWRQKINIRYIWIQLKKMQHPLLSIYHIWPNSKHLNVKSEYFVMSRFIFCFHQIKQQQCHLDGEEESNHFQSWHSKDQTYVSAAFLMHYYQITCMSWSAPLTLQSPFHLRHLRVSWLCPSHFLCAQAVRPTPPMGEQCSLSI